jgi:hypothetical protein
MKTTLLFTTLLFCSLLHAQEEKHLQGTTDSMTDNGIIQVSNSVQAAILEVRVFPNPSKGELTIEGKEGSTITIYSVSAIYVGTWLIGQEGKVPLNDLTSGSYICSVELEGNRCMKRFVVL